MKVLLLGDIHGNTNQELDHAIYQAEQEQAEVIIGLGDFGFTFDERKVLAVAASAPMPIHFLRGNHDSTDWIKDRNNGVLTGIESVEVSENLHYLPDGSRHMYGDKHVAVLGGAVSIDRHRRAENFSWWRQEPTPTEAVMELLLHDFQNARSKPKTVDVLLTHDVPECPVAIADLIDSYKRDPASETNRMLLRQTFDYLKPAEVFHGHYHHRYTEEYAGAVFTGLDCAGRDARIIVDW